MSFTHCNVKFRADFTDQIGAGFEPLHSQSTAMSSKYQCIPVLDKLFDTLSEMYPDVHITVTAKCRDNNSTYTHTYRIDSTRNFVYDGDNPLITY